MSKEDIVLALDSGTSSSRVLAFSLKTGETVADHHVALNQIFGNERMELNADEIIDSAIKCLDVVVEKLDGYSKKNIKCLGITNQRESTIVWSKKTGKSLYNAILWNDTRTSKLVEEFSMKTPTKQSDYYLNKTGLIINTYFSVLKLVWLQREVEAVRKAKKSGDLMFGTVDSWLIYKLTGRHLTDVTNASRTMLMDIKSMDWDIELCKFFEIDPQVLPKIQKSASDFGDIQLNKLNGIKITGILGDQQAALVGQNCMKFGQSKCTFGTGAFILTNIGPEVQISKDKLLTTVAYCFNEEKAYAFEGSIPMAGDTMKWLRESLGLFSNYSELTSLIKSCNGDSAGCIFVPAFSGLMCPYWKPEARGIICGLNHNVGRAQLCLAGLESVAFQLKDVIQSIGSIPMTSLRADGGMIDNEEFCQILANICEVEIIKPSELEATSKGAAIAALKYFKTDISILTKCSSKNYKPQKLENIKTKYAEWLKAVKKTYPM